MTATVAALPGGGTSSTYALPGGQTMVIDTPPATFTPATATSAQLQEYGFPTLPSGGSALTNLQNALDVYTPEAPPPVTMTVPISPAATGATNPFIWARFTAGTQGTIADTYVGVEADVNVPTANGVGNFFMEDVTTGDVIGSCSVTPPASYTLNGGTADYETEAFDNDIEEPLYFTVSPIHFTNAE